MPPGKANFNAAVGNQKFERKSQMKKSAKLFALTLVLGLLSIPISAVANYDDDDQPHMQAALDALKSAETHLKEAKHDKGGHRVAALKATEEAIKHVEAGMKAGDKNEDKHEKK
jgi:hypothetical protein